MGYMRIRIIFIFGEPLDRAQIVVVVVEVVVAVVAVAVVTTTIIIVVVIIIIIALHPITTICNPLMYLSSMTLAQTWI